MRMKTYEKILFPIRVILYPFYLISEKFNYVWILLFGLTVSGLFFISGNRTMAFYWFIGLGILFPICETIRFLFYEGPSIINGWASKK